MGPTTNELRYCATAGCPKKAFARGLCITCYCRARRQGRLPRRVERTRLTEQKTRIDQRYAKALRKLSRITGRSCSELVREAVETYLNAAFPNGGVDKVSDEPRE